jgi:MinD superfamily P-loop ATPase
MTQTEWDAQRAARKAEAAKVVEANAKAAAKRKKDYYAGKLVVDDGTGTSAPVTSAPVTTDEAVVTDYTKLIKADLHAEIERRNEGRLIDVITPKSDKNDDLIAALVADDNKGV